MKEIWGKQVCETLEEVLDPDGCAVVAVDIQNDVMHLDGKFAKIGHDISGMQEILPRCGAFIREARTLGVMVVHVQLINLPEGQSHSPSWIRALGTISRDTEFVLEGSWGAEICEECAPLPGEPVVTKQRSSAFHETNLDVILRSNGIRTVVVIGEQTPGCVEATYRDAAYHDYYNVLVEDCVAAFDPELHEASLKIQRARHDVCRAEEAVSIWRRARAAQGEVQYAASS